MNRSLIIAVASSAADLEPVSELLSGLSATFLQTLIIVQHLDPSRRAMPLVEALAGRTSVPVVAACDGVVPERGHIYVLRANATFTIVGGRIRVSPGTSGLHGSADSLFTCLAEELGPNAIGVVLSGGGSDGALGVRAIKQAGGTSFAQYPGSARFPSMPISAIETGCVASVLRPNEIAREMGFLANAVT